MIEIIPSVLATSEEQYQQDMGKYSSCAGLEGSWVHIDFTDNKFVQNQTIGPEVIEKSPDSFNKEAHLMVSNPLEWIDGLIKSGFKRVIIHIESEQVEETLEYAKIKGLEVGLALKDETSIGQLEPFISRIGTILVMSIIPGFQGQPFLPNALKKIEEIKNKGWGIRVGVDGAIKDDNIKEIILAGADFVIVGSYLLKGNIDENLEILWEAIND